MKLTVISSSFQQRWHGPATMVTVTAIVIRILDMKRTSQAIIMSRVLALQVALQEVHLA